MKSDFKPAWWLPSPHLQTIWPRYFRKRPKLDFRHEEFGLDDGDFVDLCWSKRDRGLPVLILHGLEGSINSPYSFGLFTALESRGLRPVFMHFRGCSGRHNKLDRAYHSGDTADIAAVVEHIRNKTQSKSIAAVGYSLGGNALLKWLGETQADNPLARAAAISVPFQLDETVNRLDRGMSKLYREYLLDKLRKKTSDKFSTRPSPIRADVSQMKSFWDYDEHVTAPLHGFDSALDYYQQCSSRQFLKEITVPTLIIHALDDPFMYESSVPDESELSENIEFLLSRHGGHVGFISGTVPWNAHYWHEEKICDFLQQTV